AGALADAQLARISEAITRVVARHPSVRIAVVAGLGAFLGQAAARATGLEVTPLAALLGEAAARCAPAAAVGLLFDLASAPAAAPEKGPYPFFSGGLPDEAARTTGPIAAKKGPFALHWGYDAPEKGPYPFFPAVDIVVKIGGVLANREHFEAAMAAIDAAARDRRLLVVPGGGPFADAVRAAD